MGESHDLSKFQLEFTFAPVYPIGISLENKNNQLYYIIKLT